MTANEEFSQRFDSVERRIDLPKENVRGKAFPHVDHRNCSVGPPNDYGHCMCKRPWFGSCWDVQSWWVLGIGVDPPSHNLRLLTLHDFRCEALWVVLPQHGKLKMSNTQYPNKCIGRNGKGPPQMTLLGKSRRWAPKPN